MLETIVGIIGAAVLAVIGWAVALSSRVAVLEADKISLKELLDAKLENITVRLARIESMLDASSR